MKQTLFDFCEKHDLHCQEEQTKKEILTIVTIPKDGFKFPDDFIIRRNSLITDQRHYSEMLDDVRRILREGPNE